MKKIFSMFTVLFFLFIGFSAYAEVWYQGECSHAPEIRKAEKAEKMEAQKAKVKKTKKSKEEISRIKWCDLPRKRFGEKCLGPM